MSLGHFSAKLVASCVQEMSWESLDGRLGAILGAFLALWDFAIELWASKFSFKKIFSLKPIFDCLFLFVFPTACFKISDSAVYFLSQAKHPPKTHKNRKSEDFQVCDF